MMVGFLLGLLFVGALVLIVNSGTHVR
jgi:hypothetical protein